MNFGIYYKSTLAKQLAERDVVSRYKGSLLGLFWTVINPLLLLSIYTFVFSKVFKMRWGHGPQNDNIGLFALNIMVGMIIFGFFSECLNRSSSILIGNSAYVKKVVFPLESLPASVVLSSMFNAFMSIIVFMGGYFIFMGLPHAAFIYLIPLCLPLILFTFGICWAISSLGVYFRDLQHLIGTFTTMLMFLTPVFYSIKMVPSSLRKYVYMNPLVYFIESSRDIIFQNKIFSLNSYLIALSISVLVFFLGYYWFKMTKSGFSDVL